MSEPHTRQRTLAMTTVFCATLLLWPLAAWAHVESGQAGGFLSGLSHPVSGLDHVVAMVAVGLWGAFLGNPAICCGTGRVRYNQEPDRRPQGQRPLGQGRAALRGRVGACHEATLNPGPGA